MSSALSQAVELNSRAVEQLTQPNLRLVLPVLKQAREELQRGLEAWLCKTDRDARYTVHQHRALLAQLNKSIETIQHRLGPAALGDMRRDGIGAGRAAAANLNKVVEAGARQFGTPSLRLEVAALLRDADHVLMHRYAASAARYAGAVGTRVQRDLAVSLLRGDSVHQMTQRLLRGGPKPRGEDDAAAAAAKRAFFRSYGDAERLVRTELVNAYGEVQTIALEQANRDDYGWLKKWDAANDRRTCAVCRDLDGIVVAPEESFPGGYDHPPAHPNCRCAIVPWRAEWPQN